MTSGLGERSLVCLVSRVVGKDKHIAHLPIVVWVPCEHLPRDVGYVRLDSVRYTECQVLAYAEARDKDLYKNEETLHEQCKDSSDDSTELSSSESTPERYLGDDVQTLETSFISVIKGMTTEGYESAEDDVVYMRESADVELTDYAQGLAVLPE
ncbi:hypothetical protein PHMEG_0002582 [Phytophthora megakarya]|uniref:Uncharacterized protein n=1 Tax=Phytophthora megakarya TaxID=4795 RepID=A0A225X0A9_9STRA|nr:hypothetical protein PHMEG_0002582 [Phytophthora megakarya]